MGNQWGAHRRGSRGKRRVTYQRARLSKPWLALANDEGPNFSLAFQHLRPHQHFHINEFV
jgi:hypothetical protein